MKVIRIVLDEKDLRAADGEARCAGINRSALFRKALAYYLRQPQIVLEERHRRGYEAKPVEPGEFDVWDKVRAWTGRLQ